MPKLMNVYAFSLFSILCVLANLSVTYAQNAILATYNYEVLVPPAVQRIPPSTMKQQTIAKIKGMRRTFTLYHKGNICAFAQGYKGGAVFNAQGANASYADTDKNQHLQVEELLGSTHLVSEPLPKYEWFYGDDETKVILGKVCHKATLASAPNKVNAWYTEELSDHPVGPLGFNGLPGLIMELEFVDELICKVTKINTKANAKIRVKPPTAKTIRTREQYEAIRQKVCAEKGIKDNARIIIQL